MERILKCDREGWALGVGKCGELVVGTVSMSNGKPGELLDMFCTAIDTGANRTKLEQVWKSNSFAKEIKVEG